MVKIAYLLLCHKDPEGVIAQAERLTAAGDFIAIHFDGNAPRVQYEQIKAALRDNASVAFAPRRHRCGWGEWSLVAATIELARTALTAFPRASHFYMLSGDCMAIKTAEYAHDFLARDNVDYIEAHDFLTSDWIKTGMKEDRLIYRHWFNERRNKLWFYRSLDLQRRLGLSRQIPSDLRVMIGSQWWCLRRQTLEWVLDFASRRPDIMRFFRTTWIPDETFFQTLVRHLVPDAEINSRTLTFLIFTDYGMPVTFYDDHHDLLLAQDYIFARKISPEALTLKERLGELYSQTGHEFRISNEGRRLFSYVTERGRVGRRYAPRFWERGTSLGREKVLMIVTCKKWHVAKRLTERITALTGMPTVNYLFNEVSCALPDMGGIEGTLDKRTRHRRAVVRMLFEIWQTDRLLICIDPASFELIEDFCSDRTNVRLLEVECDFTDDYLLGHAMRVGLAAPSSAPDVLERLLPTIRYDVRYESQRLLDADFEGFDRMRQSASPQENATALARFLGTGHEIAREIAATDHLFTD